MILATLKQKLQTLTGTSIGEVFFDWKIYFEENRLRTFPCVVWNLDGAEFLKDARTSTIQKWKIFTLTAFVINVFPNDSDKKAGASSGAAIEAPIANAVGKKLPNPPLPPPPAIISPYN